MATDQKKNGDQDQNHERLREQFQDQMRKMLDVRDHGHVDGTGADGEVKDMWGEEYGERRLWEFHGKNLPKKSGTDKGKEDSGKEAEGSELKDSSKPQ